VRSPRLFWHDGGLTLLAIKLVLTPLLIALASLAARRFGQHIGGFITGLPLTSAPVSLFLALERGTSFAAEAALATLAGLAAMGTFALGYAHATRRTGWLPSALFGIACFLATVLSLRAIEAPVAITFFAVLAVLAGSFLAMPSVRATGRPRVKAQPSWDIPARMIVATAIVLTITALAEALGPRLSGLLSPFPVFSTVLAAFAHHQEGSAAATRFLRGVVIGAFAAATFFLVVTVSLHPFGISSTYVFATVAALVVNAITLSWSSRASSIATPSPREAQ
jgi:hypothetical protein